MNISLIITLFIAASVIAVWAGIYLANRKMSGQLTDKDIKKEYEQYLKKLREPKPETVVQIAVEVLEPVKAIKNKAVEKLSPELQKPAGNIRTGSKTPQLNKKTKRK